VIQNEMNSLRCYAMRRTVRFNSMALSSFPRRSDLLRAKKGHQVDVMSLS
jgi:hypothetical protein